MSAKHLPTTIQAQWDPIEGEYVSVNATRHGLGIIHAQARDAFQKTAQAIVRDKIGENVFFIRFLPSGDHVRCTI